MYEGVQQSWPLGINVRGLLEKFIHNTRLYQKNEPTRRFSKVTLKTQNEEKCKISVKFRTGISVRGRSEKLN